MSGRLIHTGQVVLDLVMRVPKLPVSGGDVMASTMDFLPGGGFNVMAAAARAGADVLYAGMHGTGNFADLARAAMAAEGIVLAHGRSGEGDTGISVALVEDNGERTFITGTGAEGRMPRGLLDEIVPTGHDVVYLTGYSLLHETNAEALTHWLPRAGDATVLFDPGPLAGDIPAPVLSAVLSHVDILSCNVREADILDVGSDRVETVIVRDGPAGCRVVTAERVVTVPGFAVDAVDTNGAGDAHCGVLAAELIAGTELVEATRRANAAAAIAVTRRGPATSPGRAELDAFLRGFRL
ncbi:PfkB family carbohydrate kinase [Amycolatopsis regifaucium]|uniref:Sugar kinase n=1 Tax=Amycolatopsis regifaucium TaxID=546365 RepID=A0A154M3V3_9PSEU|nr:PfkB family carbohydrate kinase [Amycolatopsis regifaucium]KZB79295.1 sugar kinase [Amycolatopsis regifaucium]OKA07477.1 sugar kinase [Amycolatopsis regifaucium]SFH10622.1 Sugar or nucleoside kinase, ribokinase family [Amycolatopsis regifaucium]